MPAVTPKPAAQIALDRQILIARYSPCGKLLVGGGYEGDVLRWSIADDGAHTEIPALSGHDGWVQALAFAPAGEKLFTADSWGRLSAWNYTEENPQPLWSLPHAHDGWIRSLAAHPGSDRIATCGLDRRVRVWSAADGKLAWESEPQSDDLYAVTFHPNGEFLVVADLKGAVRALRADTGALVRAFDASALYKYDRLQDVGGVWCLAFDAAGETLFCGGTTPTNGATVQGAPTVLAFDFAGGELRHTRTLGQKQDCYVHDLHWHADGFLVAVTSGTPGTGQVLLLRPADEQPFFVDNKQPNCHSAALHPDGRRFAVVTTNRGSNGNGRPLDKDGNYLGNTSPIVVFELNGE